MDQDRSTLVRTLDSSPAERGADPPIHARVELLHRCFEASQAKRGAPLAEQIYCTCCTGVVVGRGDLKPKAVRLPPVRSSRRTLLVLAHSSIIQAASAPTRGILLSPLCKPRSTTLDPYRIAPLFALRDLSIAATFRRAHSRSAAERAAAIVEAMTVVRISTLRMTP